MKRSLACLLVCISIAGISAPQTIASTDDAFKTCVGNADPSRKLEACNEALAALDKPDLKAAALAHRALAHHLQARYSEALADIEEALRLTPGHPTLLHTKGRILNASGRFEAALAVLDEVLQLTPDDESMLRSKVRALAELERYDEALELSALLTEKHPASYFVWVTRARALRRAGQNGKALWTAWHAINIEDKRAHAHKLRSDIYLDLARLDDARDAFKFSLAYLVTNAKKRTEEFEANLKVAEAAQTKEPGKTLLEQGQQAFADKDYKKALSLFHEAAKAGNKSATGNVAYMYSTGLGTNTDRDMAAQWFQKGAERGSREAMYNLYVVLAEGKGVTRDTKAASRWLHRSAKLGYVLAMRELGIAYEFGEHVTKDPYLAAGLFRAAAEHNETTALFRLGRMYEEGRGVPQDSVKAAGLVSEAVNQQDASVLDEISKYHDHWSTPFWSEMQTIMRDLKVYKGATDGVVGPDTLKALKALASDDY